MSLFFTSDLHFGHANVINYSNRPFSSVEEMDETLIKNWNSVVANNDIVYLLGDVSFHKPIKTIEILKQLKGQIHLVRGNHDHKSLPLERFMSVSDFKEINILEQKIILCHFSLRVWNKSHYGSWHLHGHSHGTLPPLGKSHDVGVDCNDYKPISFDEIKELMSKRDFISIDHHDEKNRR